MSDAGTHDPTSRPRGRSSTRAVIAVLPKFRRAFRLLGERRGQVVRGLLCMPVSALIVLAIATLLGDVVDALRGAGEAAGGGDGETTPYGAGALARDCGLLAALAVGDGLLRFAGRHQLINASRHMEARLKSDLTAHLQRLPIAWFDQARTGDLLSRLTQDVELLRFVTGPSLLYGTTSLFLVPGGIWVMLSFSPLVAGAAALAFTVMLVGIVRLMPAMQRHSKAVQESIAAVSQRAAENFAGIRVLLAFARGDLELAKIHALSDEYVDHNIDLARLRARFNLLVHGCREFVVILVVVLGAVEVARGAMTVGELLSFLALLGAMIWPLIAIGWIFATWHRAVAAADRIEEIFAAEPEPRLETSPAARPAADGSSPSLRFEHLTFSHAGALTPALRDVSIEVPAGQKVGFVGPVGSGKSSLLAVLLRFYDPPRGTVFVDGVDVLDLDPAALRARFALAPQDPFLFSDTLAGNIAFGAPPAVRDDDADLVPAAARAAALDQDREAFPDGWQTIVGERGVTLSGGQKQRTALARAFAANRDALLLDDALSAVDHATEARILERLDGARGTRTTLVVAHRLSIVRDADVIFVLESGRVTAHGTHDELVARPGFYANTWRRQREESRLERGEAGRRQEGEPS